MGNVLSNLPPVVKNLLIINVVMYLLSMLGETQGIPMTRLLGGYVFNSPFFEPYQMVTHFFMHSTQSFFHIFFNMFALVVFGSVLERVWGAKRFFIFYIVTGLGAFFIHQIVGYIDVNNLKETLVSMGYDMYDLNLKIKNSDFDSIYILQPEAKTVLREYISGVSIPVVGASGAVYGLLAGFAYLFPNTELMLIFPPIPVKAKWLVLFLVGIAFFNAFSDSTSNIAHLAHLGGAIVGFILVLIWQKNSSNFY